MFFEEKEEKQLVGYFSYISSDRCIAHFLVFSELSPLENVSDFLEFNLLSAFLEYSIVLV